MKTLTTTALIVFFLTLAVTFIITRFDRPAPEEGYDTYQINTKDTATTLAPTTEETRIVRDTPTSTPTHTTTTPLREKNTTDTSPSSPTPPADTTKHSTETYHVQPPHINLASLTFALKKKQTGTFTLQEVAQHNTRNNCYLIINGNVYDVSSYIGKHPGGASTIVSRCGREVTGIFAKIHSNRAWDLLKDYKIGTVSTNSTTVADQVLNALSDALARANPDVQVVKVLPKGNAFIAKLLYNDTLYEVHISQSGTIIKEEVESQEPNWSQWESDTDDSNL